jgi:hypothetical protein
MMRQLAMAGLALLPLAGCSAETEREPLVRAPEARAVGEPVSCIQVRQIEQTRVYDDYTIDFDLPGGRTMRNTLPQRCAALGFNRAFTYDVTTAQLCEVDTINVVMTNARRGTACRLGKFVPIELVE